VREALEQNELEPCFQPIVEIRSGQLVGFEVLTRWRDPLLGVGLPHNFIELAEQDGLMKSLTAQVVRRAFQKLDLLPPSIQLAINISPRQLEDLTLPRQIGDLARETNFPMNRLVVEITESALIHPMERAKTILNELHAMGCTLALDDFGTGYSSLSHLHALPFDRLKIDLSFVRTMTSSREGRKIVASIIGLSHSLGMTTVAEGVETEEQAELLLWLGCEFAQGWLYGKCTIEVDALEAMLAATPQAISPKLGTLPVSGLEALPAQRLAQLQAIYDGAPVGLCFLDAKLRYISVNARLAELNGLPVAEHIGRTVQEVLPEGYPRFRRYLEEALRGKVVNEVAMKRPAKFPGGREWTALASYQPAFDEAGEVVGVSVAVLDISDRQRAEDALRKSEAELRSVFEAVPVGIFIADAPSGRVTKINNEARRIHKDLLPAPRTIAEYEQWELTHPGGGAVRSEDYPLARALKRGEANRSLLMRTRSDGSQVMVDTWAGPVRGQDGSIVGAIAVVNDVEAVRKLSGLLQRAIKELRGVLLNAAQEKRSLESR
jgi:PAS domain S-box-containing protein